MEHVCCLPTQPLSSVLVAVVEVVCHSLQEFRKRKDAIETS